eukprot:m.181719 g.181719  ORF g.181719 m.181719 type:complete len:85 (+) comp53473_c0_seq13:750-1004(+)
MNALGATNITQVIEAVSANLLSVCQQIVRRCGSDVITAVCAADSTTSGWTALHRAVFEKRAEILEWFLQQSINCNALSNWAIRR